MAPSHRSADTAVVADALEITERARKLAGAVELDANIGDVRVAPLRRLLLLVQRLLAVVVVVQLLLLLLQLLQLS